MGIDPTKSYQLSYHVNHLVHNVGERMLHDMFQSTGKCADIVFDVLDKDSFQKIPNSSKMIIKSRCNTTIIKYTQMFEK